MAANRYRFREWDGERMVEDLSDMYVRTADGMPMEEEDDHHGMYLESRESWTLMQSTGLTDRNGVEIFEGDVVRCDIFCDGYTLPHRGEIVWCDVFASWATLNMSGKTLMYKIDRRAIEVIGDIHQNPELLEAS